MFSYWDSAPANDIEWLKDDAGPFDYLWISKSSIFKVNLLFPNWPSLPGLLKRSFCYVIGKSILRAFADNFFGITLVNGYIGFEFVIN